MARTTSNDVAEILDTSLGPDALAAHIEAASFVVDDIASADTSVTAARLKVIEKYVAAHYASAQDQRAERHSGASRSVSYQGDTGMGFEATTYGQRALSLDPTSVLASSDKPAAGLSVPDAKGIED